MVAEPILPLLSELDITLVFSQQWSRSCFVPDTHLAAEVNLLPVTVSDWHNCQTNHKLHIFDDLDSWSEK